MRSGSVSLRSRFVLYPRSGRLAHRRFPGINPVLDTWNSTVRGTTTVSPASLSKAQSVMTATTVALFSQISTLRAFLAANGTAADFLVLPLPPTQLIPIAKYLAKNNTGFMNLFEQLTTTYNAGIASGLAGLANSSTSSVLSYDIPSLYTSMVANPAQVRAPTRRLLSPSVVDIPCLQAGVSDSTTACLIGQKECVTPSTHMFWCATPLHGICFTKLIAPVVRWTGTRCTTRPECTSTSRSNSRPSSIRSGLARPPRDAPILGCLARSTHPLVGRRSYPPSEPQDGPARSLIGTRVGC